MYALSALLRRPSNNIIPKWFNIEISGIKGLISDSRDNFASRSSILSALKQVLSNGQIKTAHGHKGPHEWDDLMYVQEITGECLCLLGSGVLSTHIIIVTFIMYLYVICLVKSC